MENKKIVFLASDCDSSRWVYNALCRYFTIDAAIIETPVSKTTLFKRRMKKIGLVNVMGQALFSVFVVPFLRRKAKSRRSELIEQYQLDDTGFAPAKTSRVDSVNDASCKQRLLHIKPSIIIVNGTRIISKEILECTNAVFINMHAGITPWYRGSHGGYWALYNNDANNFGTTIHIIDTGIDTGAVLKQVFIQPGKQDNFATYPLLQTAIGIEALKNILPAVLEGNYEAKQNAERGRMYYQPTIWQYIFG